MLYIFVLSMKSFFEQHFFALFRFVEYCSIFLKVGITIKTFH
ncbi:hypothetical protein DZA65_03543 [Dickeya dianthicola]|nr:hypothetical protein DDI_3303 [Dickeya dianthicola RNS04.9]AYC20395.1 hypothetical protein DZA65_03543 [Dickeya dianthicola]